MSLILIGKRFTFSHTRILLPITVFLLLTASLHSQEKKIRPLPKGWNKVDNSVAPWTFKSRPIEEIERDKARIEKEERDKLIVYGLTGFTVIFLGVIVYKVWKPAQV